MRDEKRILSNDQSRRKDRYHTDIFNRFSIISTLTDVSIFDDYIIGTSEQWENILFSPLLDSYDLDLDKIIIKYDKLLNYQELSDGDHISEYHMKNEILCGYIQWDKTYFIYRKKDLHSIPSWKDCKLQEDENEKQKQQKFESAIQQNLEDFFTWKTSEDENNPAF